MTHLRTPGPAPPKGEQRKSDLLPEQIGRKAARKLRGKVHPICARGPGVYAGEG